MNWFLIDEKIKAWLNEDLHNGDLTTDYLIDDSVQVKGNFIAKEAGVIAGLEVMGRVFQILDPNIVLENLISEGSSVDKGDLIAKIAGPARSILKGERLALNILQRLSGIASQTAQYVRLLEGLQTRVVDTRKTIPGLRYLEKYAVRVGGGFNHRFNLSDGVLIKDNHIKACGGITTAVQRAKERIPHTGKVEVEVETLSQLEEALAAKADIIMLDNMDIPTMKRAVELTQGQAILEASGNISLANLRAVAETGVDIISVGALTHSVKALDISLRFIEES
ncbi:carboxylating nicotinate-nucleotide diphosphorylase [Bacillota bacterium LX-D]|nr:carboxylating nicotinate-nucleotide diphosphorylase [Bacillota bacterium LX-D]